MHVLTNKKLLSLLSLNMMTLSILLFPSSLALVTYDLTLILEFKICTLSSSTFFFTFLMDWMSALFSSFVLFIASTVIFYSLSYMSSEKFLNRFILILFSFVLSMVLMITSLNMISILLGWDGLGLSSYLLVAFYQNEKSNSASMLTALTNRLGDVLILIAIGLNLDMGSWNFMTSAEPSNSVALMSLAALTKSAQIPFSAWLPAAMAAPTPVSSLVHSSTLVTAGVYLLIRLEPVIPFLLKTFIFSLSSLTMMMASINANLETDFKKIIALSTLSQLGVMISSLSLGFKSIAFLHLITHATFKAMLFLSAGKTIHNSSNTQDLRAQLTNNSLNPLSAMVFSLASLALMGFPFMAGFYSKDLLIEMNLFKLPGYWVFFMFSFATGLTAAYSLRALSLTQISSTSLCPYSSCKDYDPLMTPSAINLSLLAISSGAIITYSIFTLPPIPLISGPEKIMALSVTIAGMLFGSLNTISAPFSIFPASKTMSILMWFLPPISGAATSKTSLKITKTVLLSTETGWLEFSSAGKTKTFMYTLTSLFSSSQNNNLKNFLFLITITMLLLL